MSDNGPQYTAEKIRQTLYRSSEILSHSSYAMAYQTSLCPITVRNTQQIQLDNSQTNYEGLIHGTNSPRYLRSKGEAQRAIQTVNTYCG